MLKNYLKVALRSLRKRPGYTALNVVGLAVGIACCVLIGLWVVDETSYDDFHPDADRIHRVVLYGAIGGRTLEAPVTPSPLAPTMAEEFPEVAAATRVGDLNPDMLMRRSDGEEFLQENFLFVDSTFFQVFQITFLAGDAQTALAEPNTLVLTASMAEKYFPGEKALGKSITAVTDTSLYRVTGIIPDYPENSHFHFDVLATSIGQPQMESDAWISNGLRTYALLQPAVEAEAVEAKFAPLMRTHAAAQIEQFSGQTFDEFYADGNGLHYRLQPVRDIHLTSHMEFEMEPNGSLATVYVFGSIAVFILLIACINFTNLATARSAARAKEVGVRKMVGSDRASLVGQFLTESVVLSLGSMVLAAGLVAVSLPGFNALTGKAIGYDLFLSPVVWAALLGLGLGVGLLAGSYPALFLSSFEPVVVLKGAFQRTAAGGRLRNGLVVFQFAISIVLIVSTVVVYNQLAFMRDKALGFDKEHILVLNRAGLLAEQGESFKEALRAHPNVVSVGATTSLPGGIFGQSPFRPEGSGPEDRVLMSPVAVDHDYFETMGIAFAEGRPFSRSFATDTAALVLNQAAVEKLGWDTGVGKRLAFVGDTTGTLFDVVGVTQDFHVASLHEPVGPIAMSLSSPSGQGGGTLPFLVARVRPGEGAEALALLNRTWDEFLPDQPFDYAFLDRDLDALYDADRRLGSIFQVFSGLAIVIACLGLFGLAAFTTQQRTKEIGVRKVLGAGVPGIIALLSRDFLKLVLIAFAVAAPVAYVAMERWLADFAYRVTLGPIVFIVAGLIAVGIAVATVSFHTLRAATSDPVKSLRYE